MGLDLCGACEIAKMSKPEISLSPLLRLQSDTNPKQLRSGSYPTIEHRYRPPRRTGEGISSDLSVLRFFLPFSSVPLTPLSRTTLQYGDGSLNAGSDDCAAGKHSFQNAS